MSTARRTRAVPADLVAVRRCDRILDAVAGRRDAACDDPAVRLLSALVADVDADWADSTGPAGPADSASPADSAGPAGSPPVFVAHTADGPGDAGTPVRPVAGPPAAARREMLRSARTALTAGVAAALVVTTSVAVARIGQHEPVRRALGLHQPAVTAQPVSALAAARAGAALTLAREQIADGDYAAARETLRVAWRHWAATSGDQAVVLASEIEAVEARLAYAEERSRQEAARSEPAAETDSPSAPVRTGVPATAPVPLDAGDTADGADGTTEGPIDEGSPAPDGSSDGSSDGTVTDRATTGADGAGDTGGTDHGPSADLPVAPTSSPTPETSTAPAPDGSEPALSRTGEWRTAFGGDWEADGTER